MKPNGLKNYGTYCSCCWGKKADAERAVAKASARAEIEEGLEDLYLEQGETYDESCHDESCFICFPELNSL